MVFLSGYPIGIIALGWSNNTDYATQNSEAGEIATIRFSKNSEYSDFSFVEDDCEIANTNGEILQSEYTTLGNFVSDAIVSIPDTTTIPNNEILFPVMITDLENVGSVNFKIHYDAEVLEFAN